MLYMIEAVHGPETCPGANEEIRQKALSMGPKMADVAKAHGVTLQGTWVSRAAHTSYILADAPGAHAIEDTLDELGMVTWNTIAIRPVQPIEEAMRELASR